MKKLWALFVLLAASACAPAPSGTPVPSQELALPLTPLPILSDSQFYELTGAVRINAITEFAIGVLPTPAEVTLPDGEGVAVALVIEGEALPVEVSTFLTSTVMDTDRHVYPAKLAMEMGCWPQGLTATQQAWFHAAQSQPCTEDNGLPGYNGVVILFEIDAAFTGAVQLDFSLGDPAKTYFTTLP